MGDFFVKIYGAPFTFDLYKGTEQESNYFQTFDNGGNEPVKMTIHRLANGWVSYNYLRYGFVTSSGRTGSFFGMSVVFNKIYCSDFKNMYELFEGVYAAVAKESILFDIPEQGKPKYKIHTFAEAEKVMQWIEKVIGDNLRGGLANDLRPAQFPASNAEGMEARLNPKEGNPAIAEALKKYSVVSVSNLYGSGASGGGGNTVVRIVPPEVLMGLENGSRGIADETKKISDKVDAFQRDYKALKDTEKDVKGLAPRYKSLMNDIVRYKGSADDCIIKAQNWLSIKPENTARLEEVSNKLSRSRDNLDRLYQTMLIYKEDMEGKGSGNGGNGGNGGNDPTQWEVFIHKYKKMLTVAGVALVAVIGLFVWQPWNSKDVNSKSEIAEARAEVDKLLKKGRSELDDKEYDDAYKHFAEAYGKDTMYHNMYETAYVEHEKLQDTIKLIYENYNERCLSTEIDNVRNNHKDTTDAIASFESEMKKIDDDFTVSSEDRKKIRDAMPRPTTEPITGTDHSSGRNTNGKSGGTARSTNLPQVEKGSIHIKDEQGKNADDQKDNLTRGKTYKFTCSNKKGDVIKDGEWYVKDVKKPSSNGVLSWKPTVDGEYKIYYKQKNATSTEIGSITVNVKHK